MAKPPVPRPKANWTITDSQIEEMLEKHGWNDSDLTDPQRTIRIMELVMKERYGPEIQKAFDEISKEIDKAIGHQRSALDSMSRVQDVAERLGQVGKNDES